MYHPHLNLKLTVAAATLLASLALTPALASTNHMFSRTGSNPGLIADPGLACRVIYLSDATAGADYLYMSGSPWDTYTPLPQLPPADNGLGLYATRSIVYAGAAPNTINVYKPCNSALGFHLTTAGFGPPESIAVDTSNNTYATEAGSSTVDWFSGATDTATTDTARSPGLPSYLAVDNVGNVYTSGWDPTNTFQQIDICGPHMGPCSFCEAIPTPSWPGGVAIDQNQHIIVNNEIGSIWVYNAGCGTLSSSYVYSASSSPTHFHFTGITLATNETLIWGAKQFDVPQAACTTPFCVDAQAEHYNPLGIVGPIAPPKHTAVLPSQQPGGGIAVWPPGPV
jgi:hypothetical protein